MKDLLQKLPKKRGKLQETCDLAASFLKKPYLQVHAWLNYQDQSVVLNFAELIEDAKIESGVLQQDIAEALDVDKSTITKWKKNELVPKYHQIAPLLHLAKTKAKLKSPEFSKRHISRKARLGAALISFLGITLIVAIYADSSIAAHGATSSRNPFSIINLEVEVIGLKDGD